MPKIGEKHYQYTPAGMASAVDDVKKMFKMGKEMMRGMSGGDVGAKAAVMSEFKKRNEKIKEIVGPGGGSPLTQSQINRIRALNPKNDPKNKK